MSSTPEERQAEHEWDAHEATIVLGKLAEAVLEGRVSLRPQVIRVNGVQRQVQQIHVAERDDE